MFEASIGRAREGGPWSWRRRARRADDGPPFAGANVRLRRIFRHSRGQSMSRDSVPICFLCAKHAMGHLVPPVGSRHSRGSHLTRRTTRAAPERSPGRPGRSLGRWTSRSGRRISRIGRPIPLLGRRIPSRQCAGSVARAPGGVAKVPTPFAPSRTPSRGAPPPFVPSRAPIRRTPPKEARVRPNERRDRANEPRGAATIFDDEHALVQPDLTHADRLPILGMSARARLLFVVYVARATRTTWAA
jgi:hypothetical protein